MEKWYKFDCSVKWWHIDFKILWSNWAIGILFDGGRYRHEHGIMFLFLPFIIRIHWEHKSWNNSKS